MRRSLFITLIALALVVLAVAAGCDKEKIVESVEYVHETQYVEVPPDTITIVETDTVYSNTSVTDTLYVTDTVYQVNQETDTVIQYEYDTTVVYEYDTIINLVYEVDTVTITENSPDANNGLAALEYYVDQAVIDAVYSEYGYDDGWIFYLSTWQSSVVQNTTNSWDIYGYLDYWTPEWDGYLAFEYYYRVTYTGGDIGAPASWQVSEPPSAAPSGCPPGVRISPKASESQRSLLK